MNRFPKERYTSFDSSLLIFACLSSRMDKIFGGTSKELSVLPSKRKIRGRSPCFMTPERWQQVEQIFQTALDLPEPQRASYLSEVCAGDETLRDEVVNLIAYHETGDSVLKDLVPPEA